LSRDLRSSDPTAPADVRRQAPSIGPAINDRVFDLMLVITMGGLAISLFFSQSGIAIFGIPAVVLMALRIPRRPAVPEIPRLVLIMGSLLILDLFAGALLSDNIRGGLALFREQWQTAFLVLPFVVRPERSVRVRVMIVFFSAAAAAGIFGMLQYLTPLFGQADRAHGMTHPIHFSHNLAFAFTAAVLMLSLRSRLGLGTAAIAGLIFVASATAGGIILSGSRGVIAALIFACSVTLLFLNWKQSAFFILITAMLFVPLIAYNTQIRDRLTSFVYSWQSEDERGSVGNRIELWKGSLIIFRHAPIIGTGTGDFENDIRELISRGDIKPAAVTGHAHNIYLQALATRGLTGLLVLLALLASMLRWGYLGLRRGNVLSPVILACTLLIIFGGLTENNLGISKIYGTFCFTIGLFGPVLQGETDGP